MLKYADKSKNGEISLCDVSEYLSITDDGTFALSGSSIRYINFAAAKYIVNKFYQLYQEDY